MEDNVIFFVIGVCVFSMIFMNYFIYTKILKIAIPLSKKGMNATGTLLRIETRKTSKSKAFYPVVAYKTLTGRSYESRAALSCKISGMKLNQPIEIVYNPDREESFMPVQSFKMSHYYFTLVLMNVMSVVFLILFLTL